MSGPKGLVAFLRDRLHEEETAALDARRWFHHSASGRAAETASELPALMPSSEAFAAFVLTHEPDRVLTECIAKRQIIKLVTRDGWSGSNVDRDSVLRLLALPYATHPEFREKWALPE